MAPRKHPTPKLARSLAPEEIRPGMFVAVLHVVLQLVLDGCGDRTLRRDAITRLRFVPFETDGPLEVVDVCLPFVLVREPGGRQRAIDVRRCELARLGRGFARRYTRKRKRRRR